MKLRQKLLILLLCIAVTPLVFTAFYGHAKLRDMGESLSSQIGEAMQERMTHQLQLMIQYNARMLQQKGDLVKAWLKLLADAAEKSLADKAPVSQPAYLAEDYDAGRVPGTQIRASQRHFSTSDAADEKPMSVSTHAQVIKLAPGVHPEQAGDSVLRLSSLTDTYRSGYERHPNLFFWVYTSLENGVHSAYPGHGGYPPDYDGRTRPWYRNAVEAGDTVWSDSLVDATTNQALATASRPIYYPDGRLAGVVGIDVPTQALMNEIRTQAEISRDVSVFLVRASTQHGNPSLEILASLEGEPRDWRKTPDTRVMAVEDSDFYRMVNEIVDDRSGVTRLPYRGTDSVWAYGIFEQTQDALIVVFPFSDVAQRVQAVRTFVENQALSIVSIIGVFVVILLGLIVAVAWGSSLTITEPLRDLARAARDLAKGDFDVRVPVKSRDEVGQLGEVFNDIAPQLLDRMKARESLAHLGRYFSPNLAAQLTENPGLLNVGGERREMTFVFTDLEGFTQLVETTRPEDIVPVLNEYLDGMTRIIWKHEGTIDKVVGDAVHAMFGAPLEQPDHAERGIHCALELDHYSESFRKSMNAKGIAIGKTRIGINSGQVTVGNFGGEVMFDYTAHGDAINTAARLEGANKYFGTRIAVSENTMRPAGDLPARPIGRLVLKGRSTGLMTFEPLSQEDFESPRVAAYQVSYEALASNDPGALEAFRDLYREYPDDPLIEYHLNRLVAGETGDVIVLSGK
jgi:adenylate cyclase